MIKRPGHELTDRRLFSGFLLSWRLKDIVILHCPRWVVDKGLCVDAEANVSFMLHIIIWIGI